ERGPVLDVVLAPQLLARCGVVAREEVADAQRHHLAVAHGRGTPGGGEGGRRPGRRLRVVLVLPDFLTGAGVEAADDFLVVLPTKDVELVAHQGGRGDAVADFDLPFLVEFLGPGGRGVEAFGRSEERRVGKECRHVWWRI